MQLTRVLCAGLTVVAIATIGFTGTADRNTPVLLPREPVTRTNLDIPEQFTRVLVKFRDDVRARAQQNGAVVATGPAAADAQIDQVNALADRFGVSFTRAIRQSEDRLVLIEQRAAEHSLREQPDLAGMMYLDGTPEAQYRAALVLHNMRDVVEFVEFEQPMVQMGGTTREEMGRVLPYEEIYSTSAVVASIRGEGPSMNALASPANRSGSKTPLPHFNVAVRADSGLVKADGERGGAAGMQQVYSHVVNVPDARWLRLRFDTIQLSGSIAEGTGSILRLTSLKDGAVQLLDAVAAQQWRHTSAFFNGDRVLIELLAVPGTGNNRVTIASTAAGLPAQGGGVADTCGESDERDLSNDPRDARLSFTGGTCSAFLIDDRPHDFLSAGHCYEDWDPLTSDPPVTEFNVPLSNGDGSINFASPDDQYVVDPVSLQFLNAPCANDYSYFGAFENSNTGLTPLDAQGSSYGLATFPPPATGQDVTVRGYGETQSTDAPLTWNAVQKDHTAPFLVNTGTSIGYTVHTTGGNSGGVVVDDDSGLAIGIHTCGGCLDFGFNSGTAINHPGLQFALANPKGVSATDGDCPASDHGCLETGSPGCNNTTCCDVVCAIDPFCCTSGWDAVCVSLAGNNCDPDDAGQTPDFSVPRGPGGLPGGWACSATNLDACFQSYSYRFNVHPDTGEALVPFIENSAYIGGYDLRGLDHLGDELVAIGKDGSDIPGVDPGDPPGNMSRGKLVRIGVLDLSFYQDHEDLEGVIIEPDQTIITIPALTNPDHGTAMLGTVAGTDNVDANGDPNPLGVIGIAPDAEPYFFPTVSEEEGGRQLAAMTSMIFTFEPGDVAVVGFGFPTFSNQLVPITTSPAHALLLQVASDSGIITVIPAGQTPGCTGDIGEDEPEQDPAGTIVVGGMFDFLHGIGPAYCRWNTGGLAPIGTNYNIEDDGTNVDASGFAHNVVTTGYGNLFGGSDVNRRYTYNFGGTAAAAAQVAGVMTRMSALTKQFYGQPIPSAFAGALANFGGSGPAMPWEPAGQSNAHIPLCGGGPWGYTPMPDGPGECVDLTIPPGFEEGPISIGNFLNVTLGLSFIMNSEITFPTSPCENATGDCCAANDTGGCNDLACCDEVCAIDIFCCSEWDAACADLAAENCIECSDCPGEGNCCDVNDSAGCSDADCCLAVCVVDPFCCEDEWDSTCATIATSECQICIDDSILIDVNTVYGTELAGDVNGIRFPDDGLLYLSVSQFASPGQVLAGPNGGSISYLGTGHVNDLEVIAQAVPGIFPTGFVDIEVVSYVDHINIFTTQAVYAYNFSQSKYDLIDLIEIDTETAPGDDIEPYLYEVGLFGQYIRQSDLQVRLRVWVLALGGDSIEPYTMFYDSVQFVPTF